MADSILNRLTPGWAWTKVPWSFHYVGEGFGMSVVVYDLLWCIEDERVLAVLAKALDAARDEGLQGRVTVEFTHVDGVTTAKAYPEVARG